MSILKKLASQTAIYGVSSIVGRALNYLLTPLYTYLFSTSEYGVLSEFYAYIGFLNVLLTFGFETGYFRFSKTEDSQKTYSTALLFLSFLSTFFAVGLILTTPILSQLLHYENKQILFIWLAFILAFDTVGAIPFARLRNENKPFVFAGIKLIEIGVNIGLNLFFILLCKKSFDAGKDNFFAHLYSPVIGIGYIFIANFIASLVKLILLFPWIKDARWGFDFSIFKKLIRYSFPIIIIGLAGMTNEMLDRALLPHLLPGSLAENRAQTGIYGACYKLSIVMSLFIQAFRFAAEPFFFQHADKENARGNFSKIMNWFVLFCCAVFLLVTLFLDGFKIFIGPKFHEGLKIVPILLLANLFLGIYINLSIWYKLSDKTGLGAWVSIGAAVITIALNVWLIPVMGYMGSAWATLICYFLMAQVSYFLGQKYYPIPYQIGRISAYVLIAVLLFIVSRSIPQNPSIYYSFATLSLLGFITTTAYFEKKS